MLPYIYYLNIYIFNIYVCLKINHSDVFKLALKLEKITKPLIILQRIQLSI